MQVGFLGGKGHPATLSPPNPLLPPRPGAPQAASRFYLLNNDLFDNLLAVLQQGQQGAVKQEQTSRVSQSIEAH